MTTPAITQIRPAEAAARRDLVLVDVRTTVEREEMRAPESIHLPLAAVESGVTEMPRDRTLAFICGSGARSSLAAAVAAGRGLQVANVDGGMLAWAAAGLPITSGPELTDEAR